MRLTEWSAAEGFERLDGAPVHDQHGSRRSRTRLKVLMLDPSAAVAAVTHNLCNAMADAGGDVRVCTAPYWERSVGRCRTRRYQLRFEFYSRTQTRSYEAGAGLPRIFWRAMRLVGHIRTLARLLREVPRFDVVHVQWLPVPALDAAWLWLVARRTPVVYTVHNLLPHQRRSSRTARALYRIIYRIPELLFTHTQHTTRGLMADFGIGKNRIVQIRHGSMEHLLELREPVTRALSGSPPPTVLFLGQIRHYKGLDTLLRSGACLRDRVPRFRILVAGRPCVDMGPYLALTRELELGDFVEFRLGFIEEDELPRLFEQATVVAFPYRSVDQSGVAVAACTLGKAIVATPCGGLDEIVREAGNGLLVPVEDPRALADALAELLLDDALRNRLEANSLRYATHALSCTRIAEQTLAAYRSVLGDHHRSRLDVGSTTAQNGMPEI